MEGTEIDKLSVTHEEVKRVVTFLHIGDRKFPAIEVRNLLEEMQDCDGMFSAILGAFAAVIVQIVPAFAPAKDQLTEVIVTLFGLAIGGWAVEDAAQSFSARNKS